MRHRIKGFKIGRTASHRKATLAEMSNALIEHKRITTTLTKAKALRLFVEPIITRAKEDTTHNRREVFRRLGSKASVNTLFDEIGDRVRERDGGYTRVIRLGKRHGDGAEVAVIELVDYNDVKPSGSAQTKKARRTRRSGAAGRKSRSKSEAAVATPVAAETAEEQEIATEEGMENSDASELDAELTDEASEEVATAEADVADEAEAAEEEPEDEQDKSA